MTWTGDRPAFCSGPCMAQQGSRAWLDCPTRDCNFDDPDRGYRTRADGTPKAPQIVPASTTQPFMGVHEIAAYMGVTTQAVNNRRNRKRLPEPVASLKMGHVWETAAVISYLEKEGR